MNTFLRLARKIMKKIKGGFALMNIKTIYVCIQTDDTVLGKGKYISKIRV